MEISNISNKRMGEIALVLILKLIKDENNGDFAFLIELNNDLSIEKVRTRLSKDDISYLNKNKVKNEEIVSFLKKCIQKLLKESLVMN